MTTMMQKINDTGRESTHRVGNIVWRYHHITFISHHINGIDEKYRDEGLCMRIDKAKDFVDDFNGAVEFDGLDPDNLDLYFEMDSDQARRLGEALIAHADYASTGTEG
jgi:hypothetical protein